MPVNLKDSLFRTFSNIRSWKSPRQIIVIESDDWGAMRMPSRETFDFLSKAGILNDQTGYNSLDCLERKDDLELLFNVLSSHKDDCGRSPIFTFNTVMGNPDFDAIRQSGFRTYARESLFDSYQRYWGESLRTVWIGAMQAGLIRPQFHAREHLNVPLWMNDLQHGLGNTMLAFDRGFYGLNTITSSRWQTNYLEAYSAESEAELDYISQAVEAGLVEFQQQFGFRSTTFIGCNYVWPSELEVSLYREGINMLQGQRVQIMPKPDLAGRRVLRRHYTGQSNKLGQIFAVRNVFFEPYFDAGVDWVAKATREIEQAFFWGAPAIISTHRINYVGGMSVRHRDRSLRLLDALLRQIRKRWPSAEFCSSDKLAEMILERQL